MPELDLKAVFGLVIVIAGHYCHNFSSNKKAAGKGGSVAILLNWTT